MGAHETKTFRSGNSEAVRLPKGMGFGIGVDVRIERDGDRVVLTPASVEDAEEARRQMRQLLDDLNAIGRPGEIQDRESIRIEFPDRPGLY